MGICSITVFLSKSRLKNEESQLKKELRSESSLLEKLKLVVDNEFKNVILFDSIMVVGSFSKLDNYTSYTSSSLSEKLDLTLYNSSGEYLVSTISSDYLNFFIQPFSNSKRLISNGVFRTRNDDNENRIIVSLLFASDLFGYEKNTYSEILLRTNGDPEVIKHEIESFFPDYSVLIDKEQNETLYKIMQSEKLVITAISVL